MQTNRPAAIFVFTASLLALTLTIGCNPNSGVEPGTLTAADASQIAKEAYIYGFPMAVNYQTVYKQAIDSTGRDYRGAFNTLNSSKSVATPDDKFVVTPNSVNRIGTAEALPTFYRVRSNRSLCARLWEVDWRPGLSSPTAPI